MLNKLELDERRVVRKSSPMTARMTLFARLSPLAAAVLLAACSDQETTSLGGNGDGWTPVGSIETRPALSLHADGSPVFVIMCEGTATSVHVRGLEPKQAWPQPDLTIHFSGATSRSKSPDVRNVGDQAAYEFEFSIADDVLDAVRSGTPIAVTFNGQSRTLEPIPADQARSFADRCASLVPAGMRVSPPTQS